MILLRLFLTFFEVGAVSFGGGYGMISLIRELVLKNGWLSEAEFLSFIAVSESTPGPLAVNVATFIGSSQAGFPGALCATLGVVLPSFLIIWFVAARIGNLLRYAGVRSFLSGVRPCIVALILSTAASLALSTLAGFSVPGNAFAPDVRCMGILSALACAHVLIKRRRGRAPSPVLMILFSAVLGMFFYAL